LLGFVPTVPMGLTDACRLVIRAGVPMTPVEVRDRLRGIGIDLTAYSSELSAIHTVLKRLNEAGEVRIVPRPSEKMPISGNVRYRRSRSVKKSRSTCASPARHT
jgi:hypothetical protein